jgi:hypothetical protein
MRTIEHTRGSPRSHAKNVRKQHVHVDPVGFHPPARPFHRKARRMHDLHLDPPGQQIARNPKTVAAGLVEPTPAEAGVSATRRTARPAAAASAVHRSMAFSNPAISRGSTRGRRAIPGTTAPACHDLPLNSNATTSVPS